MVVWPLSKAKYDRAIQIAINRNERAKQAGRSHLTHGFEGDPELLHRVGTPGEAVLHDILGVEFEDTLYNGKLQCDVLGNEVRTTTCPVGKLIIRKNDLNERPFFLVIDYGLMNYVVIGYRYGWEAKANSGWLTNFGNDREMVWGVPQPSLISINIRNVDWILRNAVNVQRDQKGPDSADLPERW